MEKERRIKVLSLIALIVAVLGLSVAFAALSQTLTIKGTARVDAATWDVHFENTSGSTGTKISPSKAGSATATDATIDVNSTKITGINVTLTKPGDSATYTFYVVNKGTIDAKITSFTKNNPTCTSISDQTGASDKEIVCKSSNLVYKLEYEGNAEYVQSGSGTPSVGDSGDSTVKVNDMLPKNVKRKMKLTIGYNSGSSEIPKDDVEIQIPDISIIYGQS